MSRNPFVPLTGYRELPPEEMRRRASELLAEMGLRRSVRQFSRRPVPESVVEDCIRTAATAPSGANQQPWHFAIVADPAVKRRIREAAEAEEREFYAHRAPEAWLRVLEPLGTDSHKPFLEDAPCLIAIFAEAYRVDDSGEKAHNYYVSESVGIATGMLVTALHHAGLASLTHTPSPMRFLNEILGRPANERPYMILVVGYPAADARVPEIPKKAWGEIVSRF